MLIVICYNIFYHDCGNANSLQYAVRAWEDHWGIGWDDFVM